MATDTLPTSTPAETVTPADTATAIPTSTSIGGFVTAPHRETRAQIGLVRLVNSGQAVLGLAKLVAPSVLMSDGTISATITYQYDSLNRLTATTYSSGAFFDYTDDSVGNRLTEQTALGSTSYGYDSANRLTIVNGISQTWDANGNLLTDYTGTTYGYDAANRLITMTLAGETGTYALAYNGLGDRVRQTINGTSTNYALDLNAGLTQVLSDGSNAYLYGLARAVLR